MQCNVNLVVFGCGAGQHVDKVAIRTISNS